MKLLAAVGFRPLYFSAQKFRWFGIYQQVPWDFDKA